MSHESSQLPVPAGPRVDHDAPRVRAGRGRGQAAEGPYAAQLLSGGEKRGLKGGPDMLERAKASYLQSEYSGQNDRRPRPGRVTRTEI
ncbi:MAG: hypothetical protein ACTHLA_16570 [Asticcacaulis sp.]|uniref:hypothetical protein n=1 Tax=Asticcacaulis sp. TaxID=1872648 RepID=UPI003F7CB03F